jgi:hypothetical protein
VSRIGVAGGTGLVGRHVMEALRRAGRRGGCPSATVGLLSEGVENPDSGQLEVLDVAGDHGHAVHPRRCCNERVDHRERMRVRLTAPGSGDREGDREHPVLEPGLHIPEPAFEAEAWYRSPRPRTLAIPCSISPRVSTETCNRSGGVAAIQSDTPAVGWRLRVSDNTLVSSR